MFSIRMEMYQELFPPIFPNNIPRHALEDFFGQFRLLYSTVKYSVVNFESLFNLIA